VPERRMPADGDAPARNTGPLPTASGELLRMLRGFDRVDFVEGSRGPGMVSAAIGTVFVQESAEAARDQWRTVADQLRAKFPELSALMDDAEHDVLTFMTFPWAHWAQIYSTNLLERLNAEIKRRTDVVGIFPNYASITRLVGAMMLEQNDEWSLNRRCMQLEGLQTLYGTLPTRLSTVAR